MSDRARKFSIVAKAGAVPETEYVSEVAESIARLTDAAYAIAGGLFAIAGGMNTKDPASQRDMSAVFEADARDRYGDVLKRLTDDQRKQLDAFVSGLCRGRR